MKSKNIHIPFESWVGFLSSFSEAYNISLIPFMVPILSPIIFPQALEADSLFFSYSMIFFGSFVMYPLGAFYYGNMGDKKGRLLSCISSSFGLAIVTGLMAGAPVPFWGEHLWVFFLIFSCLQFFFSAGEYYSSIIFSLEHRPGLNQGLISGLSCFFAVLGLLMANGLSVISGRIGGLIGWRLPFIVGLCAGFVSFGFKYRCKESPLFKEPFAEKNIHYAFIIKKHIVPIIRIIFVTGLFYSIYSYIFLFLPLLPLHATSKNSEWHTFLSLFFYGGGLVLSGYFSDKIGIKKMMLAGLCVSAITLLFFLLSFPKNILLMKILLAFSCSVYIGPIHGWMVEQVPSSFRCRVVSIGIAISTMFFSNSAVPLCLLIHQHTRALFLTASYIFGLIIISFYILWNTHIRR